MKFNSPEASICLFAHFLSKHFLNTKYLSLIHVGPGTLRSSQCSVETHSKLLLYGMKAYQRGLHRGLPGREMISAWLGEQLAQACRGVLLELGFEECLQRDHQVNKWPN